MQSIKSVKCEQYKFIIKLNEVCFLKKKKKEQARTQVLGLSLSIRERFKKKKKELIYMQCVCVYACMVMRVCQFLYSNLSEKIRALRQCYFHFRNKNGNNTAIKMAPPSLLFSTTRMNTFQDRVYRQNVQNVSVLFFIVDNLQYYYFLDLCGSTTNKLELNL